MCPLEYGSRPPQAPHSQPDKPTVLDLGAGLNLRVRTQSKRADLAFPSTLRGVRSMRLHNTRCLACLRQSSVWGRGACASHTSGPATRHRPVAGHTSAVNARTRYGANPRQSYMYWPSRLALANTKSANASVLEKRELSNARVSTPFRSNRPYVETQAGRQPHGWAIALSLLLLRRFLDRKCCSAFAA